MTRSAYKPQDKSRKPGRKYGRGFAAISGLVDRQIGTAGKKRGFAVMRMVTHWGEIVGPKIADIAQPVDVSYAREGFGATLTVLTTGSHAPIVQTMLPEIQQKVNACYGYHAISRVRITQTAPAGFSEGRSTLKQAGASKARSTPPEIVQASSELAKDVENTDLKQALERLGTSVLSRKLKTQS